MTGVCVGNLACLNISDVSFVLQFNAALTWTLGVDWKFFVLVCLFVCFFESFVLLSDRDRPGHQTCRYFADSARRPRFDVGLLLSCVEPNMCPLRSICSVNADEPYRSMVSVTLLKADVFLIR